MGVMLFPSLWLGNASGRGGGAGCWGWWCMLCAALLAFLPFSSPSPIPLFFSFLSFFLSCSTAFSSASSSFSLLCPHLFFLFSSILSSFHYVFLLCLPSPSFFFFEINHFLFHPHLFLLFFLRELLVLCALRELLILYALRELLVLYAFYDVIEDTIDCNQP